MGMIAAAQSDAKIAALEELLNVDGYRPKRLDNNLIEVRIQGGLYLVSLDPSDPKFFQIGYPNLWVESDPSRMPAVYEACNFANARAKFAKCYVENQSVHCIINVLFASPEEFFVNFARYISALQYATASFVEKITPKPV